MALGMISAQAMGAGARLLSAELHPLEIAFFRCVFGLLILVPLVAQGGLGMLRTRRPGLHMLRGTLHALAMMQFFAAVALTELATVAALMFSVPLFATLFAVVLLREPLGRTRLAALTVGLGGALVILRPGVVSLGWGEVFALGSSLAWALALIVTKIGSRTETSTAITIYATLFMLPVTLAAALPVWRTPEIGHLPLLFAVGAFAVLQNLTVTQAIKEADVVALQPVDFSKLIWASLFGYALFAEIPSTWTWAGGILIFSASAYLAIREHRPAGAPAAGLGPRTTP